MMIVSWPMKIYNVSVGQECLRNFYRLKRTLLKIQVLSSEICNHSAICAINQIKWVLARNIGNSRNLM